MNLKNLDDSSPRGTNGIDANTMNNSSLWFKIYSFLLSESIKRWTYSNKKIIHIPQFTKLANSFNGESLYSIMITGIKATTAIKTGIS